MCWGDNSLSQTGVLLNGSSLSMVSTPGPVTGNLKFTHVSAGVRGTCAETTVGIHCWGNIINGATIAVGAAPPLMSLPALHITDFSGVSVGDRHVCSRHGLQGTSEIHCWGANNVGQGGLEQAGLPKSVNINLVPPAFTSTLGTNVGAISAGNDFTCVNRDNGTVACVGANNVGQLGLGTTDANAHPTAQPVGGGIALRAVSAGGAHACALDASGLAFCWGGGLKGQLGQGAFANSATPVPVDGGRKYSAIAAGGRHTCAIGLDDVIYCWGLNTFGQVGIGAGERNAGYTRPQAVVQPAQ